jgi:hypothetical protein
MLLLQSYVCLQRQTHLQQVAYWNTNVKYLSFISGVFIMPYHFTIFRFLDAPFISGPFMFSSVKKHETYHAPIKSKEELIFHVGFRQFVARYGWYSV